MAGEATLKQVEDDNETAVSYHEWFGSRLVKTDINKMNLCVIDLFPAL